MLVLVALAVFINDIHGFGTPNNCWDVGIEKICPYSGTSYLKCMSRKIPLGVGISASSESNFVEPTLWVVPGDYLMCWVYCRTKKNKVVKQEYCKPEYFKLTKNQGVISSLTTGAEEGTIVFHYEAPSDYSQFINSGGKDKLEVSYDGNIILQGSVDIQFPPLITTKSELYCDFYYIRKDQNVDCRVIPKGEASNIILASPFEIQASLTVESNIDIGTFPTSSYITLTHGDATSLMFQYRGGTKHGCNNLDAIISKDLPSYNQVGNQISFSPIKLCTVYDKNEFYFSYTLLSLPFILWAIIDVLRHSVKG